MSENFQFVHILGFWSDEVDIPTKDIEKLGWEGGEELKRTIKGKKLILEPE